MEALVSVCVASYNGARFIEPQLRSILASPRVGEVLVSDDGSSDGTPEIVARLGDPRIRLIQGPRAGLVRNFEHLLCEVRGDVIFLSDQDDIWFEDKVDAMLDGLAHADLVVCDCCVVDESLQPIHASFFAVRRSGPGLLRNLARNSYLGCCMALSRRVLDRALPFPSKLPMHDWWLGLVAQAFGRVLFIDRPLMQYRRHAANASTTSQASTSSLRQRLAWRLTLASHLLRRSVRNQTRSHT